LGARSSRSVTCRPDQFSFQCAPQVGGLPVKQLHVGALPTTGAISWAVSRRNAGTRWKRDCAPEAHGARYLGCPPFLFTIPSILPFFRKISAAQASRSTQSPVDVGCWVLDVGSRGFVPQGRDPRRNGGNSQNPTASAPCSSVRTRIASSISDTNTFPSP